MKIEIRKKLARYWFTVLQDIICFEIENLEKEFSKSKNKCNLKLFNSFYDFKKDKKNGRIILMTTKAKNKYFDFKFKQNDTILFGRESAGVPKVIRECVNYQLVIPIQKNTRSLNIVSSVAIALSEALRQNSNL